MSAHDKSAKGKPNRLPVDRPSTPLGNPFAALDQFEALKSLRVEKPEPPKAPAPAPARPAQPPRRPEHTQHPQQNRNVGPTPSKKPAPPPVAPGSKGRLILRREKKDRGGKTVVVVYGFKELPGAHAAFIADLARDLKNKLGCGGSFDRQEIVLQGDRAGSVATTLEAMGFRVDGVKEDGPQV